MRVRRGWARKKKNQGLGCAALYLSVFPCTTHRSIEGMAWYGMVEVCEGAPVAVSGWVLTMHGMVWYGMLLYYSKKCLLCIF